KNRGIIQSVVGKGYYVANSDIKISQKIFLLFDELNAFKEDLYNSFLDNLGDHIQVDIYFHHFNRTLFSKLINDNIGNYNSYVIMPANMEDTNYDIQNLPSDRVFILDQTHVDLTSYPSVYQNFEKAVLNNLSKVLDMIEKYEKLILVFDKRKQPKGMLNGFLKFCEENLFDHEVVGELGSKVLEKGELYVIPDDVSLLKVLKSAKEQQYSLGEDIGVISYNDTLLKEIVADGVTTISTDFKAMGKRLAEMVLNKEQAQYENPNKLIIRNTL
ncbi:MAG: substrate-binding domain-containing protein, partial [Bacteroidota bacterium]